MRPGWKRATVVLVVAMTVLAFTYVTPAVATHTSGTTHHSGQGDSGSHLRSGGSTHGDTHSGYHAGSASHRSSSHSSRSKHEKGSYKSGGTRGKGHKGDLGTRAKDKPRSKSKDRYYSWWVGSTPGPGTHTGVYYWPSGSRDRYYNWWSSDYPRYYPSYPGTGTYERGYYWPSGSRDRYYSWWSSPYPTVGTRIEGGPGAYRGGYTEPPQVVPAEPGLQVGAPPVAQPIPIAVMRGCDVAPLKPPSSSIPPCTDTKIRENSAVPIQHRESGYLELKRPQKHERVPYYERGFNEFVTGAINWWMKPELMNQTGHFRGYQRSDALNQSRYPPGCQEFYKGMTEALDYAISQSPLRRDQVLFRGIDDWYTEKVLREARSDNKAFISTSVDPTKSISDFTARNASCYANLMVYVDPAGEPALFIDDDQREFLLPRDTCYDVISAEEVDHLQINSNFKLKSNNKTRDTIDKVRLIYIKKRPSC